MSCLSLRLPRAKRVWKTFTFKLVQSKLLHKLKKSKAIKKPRNRLNSNTTATKTIEPSLFFHQRKKHIVQHFPLITNKGRGYHLKKKSAPIYIDKLFKEAAVNVSERVVERKCPPTPPPPSAKNVFKVLDQVTVLTGTSKEGGDGMADDMWESMGLSSPQMHGIDKRAEDFIMRFRAEMELQEMMARHL
ncbi:DUF761 domain-containing protein [Cephalotus follicularis]|uniref:DUF761 domain-containing protein n=1 Tax=Cephalotus follicularis TaxID=3775 RepID=A0A1Q3BIE6_CEPFO|nr:DUF761 domain-containing protein [Cephalotus follicularis]